MKGKILYDQLVHSAMSHWKTPGLAFAVVHKGNIIFQDGFGFHNLEKQLPVTPTTLFPIGSSTKSFLGIAYAMLSVNKITDLDDQIIHTIPEFKLSNSQTTQLATWRDLLSHQTGMPRHEMLWIKKDFTGQEIVNLFPHLPMNKELGEQFQYCNPMYVAASYFLEVITHQSYESFISKQILQPLGMNSTRFSYSECIHLENMSSSYYVTNNESRKIHHFIRDNLKGAGGLISNLQDMCQWVIELVYRQKTITKEMINLSTHSNCATPLGIVSFLPNQSYSMNPGYGLGWINELYRGHRLIHHGGTINGFHSLVAFLPDHELGFVCLHNQANSMIHKSLILNCIDRQLGLEKVEWDSLLSEFIKTMPELQNPADDTQIVESTPPSHSPESYVGKYTHPAYGILKITLHKGSLFLNYGEYQATLRHCQHDTFRFHFNIFNFSENLVFHTNFKNKIDRLSLKAEPTLPSLLFKKVNKRNIIKPDKQQSIEDITADSSIKSIK